MRKILLAGFAIVGLSVMTADLQANEDLGPVETRVQVMKDTGAAMRVLSKAVKGQTDIGMLQGLAADTIAQTGKDIPSLFAAGTGPDDEGITDTRAKAEIWTQWDAFLVEAKALEDAGNAASAAVTAKDVAALGAALEQAGAACGGCHKPFRAPKN